MKFLVFEFLSSNKYDYRVPLLNEGISMLKLISEGLKRRGHEVFTMINSKLSVLVPNFNHIKIEKPMEFIEFLQFLEKTVNDFNIDYVFPIAPDAELAEIISFCHSHEIKTVGSEPDAIRNTADKWKTYRILNKKRLLQPRTFLLKNRDYHSIDFIDLPVVVKSRYGIGCENLFLLDSESKFFNTIKNMKIKDMIIQEFIDGIHASVILFSDGKKSKAVSLNKQYIKLSGNGSGYFGCRVPLEVEYSIKKRAFLLAENAVNYIGGLKGCIGVDMVIKRQKPYIIEINPRVTTSMIALEMATDLNISNAALNAFFGVLPEIREFRKEVEFKISESGIISFNDS